MYHAITIGTQTWLLENLKTTHYRNGDPISHITDNGTWSAQTTGAYCNYNNDTNNVATYGRLYNWYTVIDSRGLAPTGWHVASDAEWTTLTTYLGGLSVAGGKLKEAGTAHWASPNTGATNESGFTALPGGYRYHNGIFDNIGYYGYIWSSSEYDATYAWYRGMDYSNATVYPNSCLKKFGYSVRCVKD
jgi:uncharacterized protein (TIGR02145 family)